MPHIMRNKLDANSILGQTIPTQAAGAVATATNAANAAATAAASAISTVDQIKDAWSSPGNCIHSK